MTTVSQKLISRFTEPELLGWPYALRGNNSISVAERSKETPAKAKPASKLKPAAYGPTNPPRFATEVMSAIPDAAENPVRNSFGIEKKGPRIAVVSHDCD
jgi:hypothetical protein